MHEIRLTDAIQQLRDELRDAMLEGKDKDVVFTPETIELELALRFSTEETVSAGVKLLTFLDLSAKGKAIQESQHKIKLSLKVADNQGNPLKVASTKTHRRLPD